MSPHRSNRPGHNQLEPARPSLHFKRVDDSEPIYSVRIDIRHRALGLMEGDTITWFWIGAYDDYKRPLRA